MIKADFDFKMEHFVEKKEMYQLKTTMQNYKMCKNKNDKKSINNWAVKHYGIQKE